MLATTTQGDTVTAAFDKARERIGAAAEAAVGEAANNLLELARAAGTYVDRNRFTSAQAHLLQHREAFQRAFAAALRDKVNADVGKVGAAAAPQHAQTDWDAIGLVGDDQIEDQLSFERIGQFIGHECDIELRDLAGYTSRMLQHGWADPERNPLRGNVIGSAIHVAIEKISDDASTQKILAKEIGQPLAKGLAACYRAITQDFHARGLRRADLAVRPADMSATLGPRSFIGAEDANKGWERSLQGQMDAGAVERLRSWESSILGRPARIEPLPPDLASEGAAALLERLMRGGLPPGLGRQGPISGSGALTGEFSGLPAPARSAESIQADADLMSLLRRLNSSESVRGDFGWPAAGGATGLPAGLQANNVIRAHRDELAQAAHGQLDHMLIEVVSSLFDQILSDARVPPQMAREIARLQLPVLRVALRDQSFFASRRHPVRRFVNRISSLATAFEELDVGPGKQLLLRVDGLVKEIVEGDFDQVALFDEKLQALEDFVVEQTRAEVAAGPAGVTLRNKELEWLQQQRFSARLRAALSTVALPPYLLDFLTQPWAQVIMGALADDKDESRFRRAGCDLVVSIQPKRSLEQRKHFLATLPSLMATLKEGMAAIDWPQSSRDAFFGKLIDDHAGSLKAAPASDLDYNMMLKHLEAAFRTPLRQDDPVGDEPAEAAAPDLAAPLIEPRFSAQEASDLGLIGEAAVDWSSVIEPMSDEPVAKASPVVAAVPKDDATVDASGLPVLSTALLDAADAKPIAPAAAEAAEPTEGPQLRHHLQLGASYRLLLKDQWEKVRLTYMAPGRTLFLFTHGVNDRRSISMTARMLEKLCDARRMRTFEEGGLIDRAAERAKVQLAALKQAA